tara:strand:+ start:612 stop:1133 length:522 start_codon:yes stop_codon:yes gene_type:complete
MLLHKLALLPTIPHGITDLIECPKKTLLTYGMVGPAILTMNSDTQLMLLFVNSIYHMRKDVPFGIFGSFALHNIWILYPDISIFYLSFIHTPRHYLRSIKHKKKQKIIAISIMTIISIISIYFKIDIMLNNLFGELWWCSPVLCHILVNEIFIDNNDKIADEERLLRLSKFNI